MSAEAPGSAHLEVVIFRIMDYQSGENIDHIDTMITVSLVNLLGIISVMNKKLSFETPTARSTAVDSLMPALLSTLGQGQGQQMAQGGMPGINPALLLSSLLGAQGQRPENALLIGLLSNMLQSMQQAPRHAERNRPEFLSPDSSEVIQSNSQKENRDRGGILNWNRRLG